MSILNLSKNELLACMSVGAPVCLLLSDRVCLIAELKLCTCSFMFVTHCSYDYNYHPDMVDKPCSETAHGGAGNHSFDPVDHFLMLRDARTATSTLSSDVIKGDVRMNVMKYSNDDRNNKQSCLISECEHTTK